MDVSLTSHTLFILLFACVATTALLYAAWRGEHGRWRMALLAIAVLSCVESWVALAQS